MEFDLESKLVKVLQSHARCAKRSPFAKRDAEIFVIPEVSVGQIIPDLVIIRARRRRAPDARVIRLTGFDSWIVGELMRAGALAEPTLTTKLFARSESTLVALAKLQKLGMVRRLDSGVYVVTTNLAKRFEVVSVEAKLTRWRAAIEQAKKYLSFSDESFVALPASVIERNKQIIQRCRVEGVGLIAVTRRDVSVVLKPSPETEPDLREWTWVLSKLGRLHI